MAEQSYFWGGTVTGDASIAPYSDDEFTDIYTLLFLKMRESAGVILEYLNELSVTGAVSPVTIGTGAAIVDGKVYINTTNFTMVVPTPAVATRYDRIVLRKDFAAQTVRAYRIGGVEGAGIPVVTQIDGVTWDIPLYTVRITTGGAITLTDNRRWANTSLIPLPNIAEGRLSLVSGNPAYTSATTAAATLYYTPYFGNKITLYDGSRWRVVSFSELSISVAAWAATTNYDIFLYDNDGVLTLEGEAWTNDTTRNVAITRVDGVYVKSGNPEKKYLGTVRVETAGQIDDSLSAKHVWNYYNRIKRFFATRDVTDSWNYTTATWRAARGDTTVGVNRITFVTGVNEVGIYACNQCVYSNTGAWSAAVGIGVDSTSVDNTTYIQGNMGGAAAYGLLRAELVEMPSPGIGFHYLQRLEISVAAGTGTFYGDNGLAYVHGGMQGFVFA